MNMLVGHVLARSSHLNVCCRSFLCVVDIDALCAATARINHLHVPCNVQLWHLACRSTASFSDSCNCRNMLRGGHEVNEYDKIRFDLANDLTTR